MTNATATNAGLREDNNFLERSNQEKKAIILQNKNQIEGIIKSKDEWKTQVEEKSKEVDKLELELKKVKDRISSLTTRVIRQILFLGS